MLSAREESGLLWKIILPLKERYPSLSHFRTSLYGKRIATDSCLHNVTRGNSFVFQAVSGMFGNKLRSAAV